MVAAWIGGKRSSRSAQREGWVMVGVLRYGELRERLAGCGGCLELRPAILRHRWLANGRAGCLLALVEAALGHP